MAPKRSNRSKKKKINMRSSKRTKRNNTIGLIYYKMSKCDYCKIFEKELWNKVINHCKKNNIMCFTIYDKINRDR